MTQQTLTEDQEKFLNQMTRLISLLNVSVDNLMRVTENYKCMLATLSRIEDKIDNHMRIQ